MTPVEIAARTALILETHHLSQDTTPEEAASHLARLMPALVRQTLPLSQLAQVIVTHHQLPPVCQDALREALNCDVRFVEVDAQASAFDAKHIGWFAVDARRCDWVVFMDADCLPAPTWLHALLRPFGRRHPPEVVAGRTSYDATLAGTALTALDFLYLSHPWHPQATRNFYVNNVALRCDTLARHARQAQAAGIRRAHQMLGLVLPAAGARVHLAPEAHSVHPRPAGRQLGMRWQRGLAAVQLTPYLVRSHLPAWLQWLARTGPLAPVGLLGVRTLVSLRALNHQNLPPLRGLRRLGAWGLILGLSWLEMASALVHGLLPQRNARPLPQEPAATEFASSRLFS